MLKRCYFNGVGVVMFAIICLQINELNGGTNKTSFGQSEKGKFIFFWFSYNIIQICNEHGNV